MARGRRVEGWYEAAASRNGDDGGDEFQALPNVSNGDPKDGTELRPKGSSVGISMILGKVMDVVVMCIGPR